MSNLKFVQTICVEIPTKYRHETERCLKILKRQIHSRCSAKVSEDKSSQYIIKFGIDPEIGRDGFRITHNNHETHIIGNNNNGLLYGIGKFLRTSRYGEQGLMPGTWEGISVPKKSMRGIYFATHFKNYYEEAPIEEVQNYCEDLALWGFNAVMVWFDMHHYTSINDPEAKKTIVRLQLISDAVKSAGLELCLGMLGNEAYKDSPKEMHADFKTGRSIYNVELCPNKPGANELMIKWFAEQLEAFKDVKPDYILFTPYDQGGCACEQCAPWGANGYLEIVTKKVQFAKKHYPDLKVILNTWLFDHNRDQGEWKGLAEAFEVKPNWCDYIMAGAHNGFPEFPLKHGTPGNLPLVCFPEISMWDMFPWGGFGATPLPVHFSEYWNKIKDKVDGGFPYSEGAYEDINKVIFANFFWDPEITAEQSILEYAAFEYSPEIAEDVLRATKILEKNQGHYWFVDWITQREFRRVANIDEALANEAYEILERADAKLTTQAKSSWRWRILYLRAIIDKELSKTRGFWASDACEKAFEELTEIFYSHNSEYKCAPPTVSSRKARRSSVHAV